MDILRRTTLQSGDTERMRQLAQATIVLNRLFIGYLDHSFRDIDYIIKVKLGETLGFTHIYLYCY